MPGSYEEVLAELTGPGAPFEIAEEEIGGQLLRCFRGRERSMREKVERAARHGDRIALVQGDRRAWSAAGGSWLTHRSRIMLGVCDAYLYL